MMKSTLSRILLICSLCICMSTVRAQYVAIPDVNFGNWLNANGYSACLTGNSTVGWQLDTTCNAVLTSTGIPVNYPSISNLTGVQYFKNLQLLDCSQNPFTFLPPLPSTLLTLNSQFTGLTSLPSLPNSMLRIDIGTSSVQYLPIHLPDSLMYLDCSSNIIDSLPVLPNKLTTLYCQGNHLTHITSLPNSITDLSFGGNNIDSCPVLPTSLINLDCSGNNYHTLSSLPNFIQTLVAQHGVLTSLPVLPNSLTQIYCTGNQLTSISALPTNALDVIDFSYNNLTTIPPLPNSLSEVYLQYNQLISLPELPYHLNYFDCYNNAITSIPALGPNLTEMNCSYNQLTSLPAFPPFFSQLYCNHNLGLDCLPHIDSNQFDILNIDSTNIHCLPNRFSASSSDVNLDSLPLCGPASGCEFYYNIAGNIHNDTAATCSSDSINPGTGLSNMKIKLLQNGKVIQQFFTFNSGDYSFKTDSLTNYQVSLDTSYIPFQVLCPQSDLYTIALSTQDSLVTNTNFGLSCTLDNVYGVNSISGHFRPGYTHAIYISAGNLSLLRYRVGCMTGSSGTVTTTFTGPARYDGPGPGALIPTRVSGNTLTYDVTDLDSLTSNSLNINQYVDSSARIDDLICFTVSINPTGKMPDTLTECFVVQNSNDPNLKQVYPTGNIDTGAAQWLTYTIYFQNTGNDTAYTVVVKDTLSSNVDASTFQYLASSNKAVIQLFGSACVFTFPKINLPDSAENPTGSVGWIQYKVKTLPNLPINTQVKNTAYIYFDANPAVVTNTTVNTVDTSTSPLGIRQVAGSSPIRLYPNPNAGSFTLENNLLSGSAYTIYDMMGRLISQGTITSGRQTISVSGIEDGVYTLVAQGTVARFTVAK